MVAEFGITVLNLQNRVLLRNWIINYQIVLVTYATLGHEFKNYKKSNCNAKEGEKFIFDYSFKRVVLDEAHNIKGTNTQQFHAVMNLES